MDIINATLFKEAFNETKKIYGNNFLFTEFYAKNQYFQLFTNKNKLIEFQMNSFPNTCGTAIISNLFYNTGKKSTKIAFKIIELTCKNARKTALIYLTASNQEAIQKLLHSLKWKKMDNPFINKNSKRLNTIHIKNIYIND